MSKLESPQMQKMILDGPFGGHLSYCSSDKTHIQSLASVYDKTNKYIIWNLRNRVIND